MRSILSSSAATVFIGALFVFGEAGANPPGVPVPESPPLSCQTSDFVIEAQLGLSGEFPKAADCGGTPCSDYHYKVTTATLNIDHTVFAVSATQDLYSTSPAATVASPGDGDTATGFLAAAMHEYAVRFNCSYSKSIETHIYISGISKARISSVLLRSGGSKKSQYCRIAGPGTGGDPFQPLFQSQTALVAGGKCVATLVFDANGNLANVTTDTPGCFAGSPDGDLLVNGAPLRNNASAFGITFGDGTTTCYGPPVPSIPRCICTKAPCP